MAVLTFHKYPSSIVAHFGGGCNGEILICRAVFDWTANTEMPLTDVFERATMSSAKGMVGVDVKKICELKTEVFEKEYGELNTSEVIITDERVQHIQEHHPADYGLFEKYGKKTIEAPDIIIRDIKNESTAFLVLKLDEINLNTIVRLSVANTDSPEHRNSVMTFYRIRTKNLEKLMARHKVLYKRQEE
ncbi:MAG: hypothetical protein IJI71_03605 [Clostridia bacterium]|nr:hypothetical protein [Clostridia bacterium]